MHHGRKVINRAWSVRKARPPFLYNRPQEVITARITQVIIAVLFTITTIAGFVSLFLGAILPGAAVMGISVIGIWATINSK